MLAFIGGVALGAIVMFFVMKNNPKRMKELSDRAESAEARLRSLGR